jgi:hypothetical protein
MPLGTFESFRILDVAVPEDGHSPFGLRPSSAAATLASFRAQDLNQTQDIASVVPLKTFGSFGITDVAVPGDGHSPFGLRPSAAAATLASFRAQDLNQTQDIASVVPLKTFGSFGITDVAVPGDGHSPFGLRPSAAAAMLANFPAQDLPQTESSCLWEHSNPSESPTLLCPRTGTLRSGCGRPRPLQCGPAFARRTCNQTERYRKRYALWDIRILRNH